MNPGTSTPTHILSGWKDIANYLGKGVRTVQRYEGELRLPVRRPAGRARGSVVATTTELDAWVAASPVREEFPMTVCADSGSRTPLAEMARNIQELRVLRTQMKTLRAEVRRSVYSLRESIMMLQVNKNREHSSWFERMPVPDVRFDSSEGVRYPKAS